MEQNKPLGHGVMPWVQQHFTGLWVRGIPPGGLWGHDVHLRWLQGHDVLWDYGDMMSHCITWALHHARTDPWCHKRTYIMKTPCHEYYGYVTSYFMIMGRWHAIIKITRKSRPTGITGTSRHTRRIMETWHSMTGKWQVEDAIWTDSHARRITRIRSNAVTTELPQVYRQVQTIRKTCKRVQARSSSPQIQSYWLLLRSSVIPQMSKPALPVIPLSIVSSPVHPSLSMSSAVGRLFWFQSDGPGVGGHDVSTTMDAARVNALVELVGDNAKVSVLHDDVARDGAKDLLPIFIPAGENRKKSDDKRHFCLRMLTITEFSRWPFLYYGRGCKKQMNKMMKELTAFSVWVHVCLSNFTSHGNYKSSFRKGSLPSQFRQDKWLQSCFKLTWKNVNLPFKMVKYTE